MLVVFWKAEHNEIRQEVRGCGVEMMIRVWLKHQLTLFHLEKLTMVLRSRTSQHSTQGYHGG
jgi:hypothetical protein